MKQSNWACWTPGKYGWTRSRGTSRRLRRRGAIGKRPLLCRQRICLGVRRGAVQCVGKALVTH